MNSENCSRKCCSVIEACGSDVCPSVGYGFVIMQEPEQLFDYAPALEHGTIFPDLAIPQGKYGPDETATEVQP